MNMKNINILKYTVAAGLAIASLSSCDLDLVPEDAIAYEEGKQLFLTANDVKSFENGVLSSYRSIHYGVFYYVPDLICDGFNAAVDYGNNYGSIQFYRNYRMCIASRSTVPGTVYHSKQWNDFYKRFGRTL
jgi:hypothetical protein